jgi:3-hydroxyanthranilate 3,4-dioxygenase
MQMPFNLNKWSEDNKHLLTQPVNNVVLYKDSDFIVMILGGPNARKDFHFNEGEELFYQLKGDMKLPFIQDGKRSVIEIKEGEMFLLPPRTYHSPQRFKDTIGLVIERKRTNEEFDSCTWFCDSCNEKLYSEEFRLEDIVSQLKALLSKVYDSEEIRTCKKCGTVMEIPTAENNMYA